jgi:serine/threonine-protein kinase
MAAERHLLLGLLALQNGLIQPPHLVAAFHAWTADKSRSLADHLIALGHLSPGQRAVIEALADLHVEAHGGDVQRSLAAVPAGKSTLESLAAVRDPEIERTLRHVASGQGPSGDGDADRTASYAVGTATSEGQRFRVLRPHARGGLGAVFVALDAELNREVALKQILESHADDPTSRSRFLREAEITGGLEHPGVVPVYGLGTYADGRPFYAMRFIRGDSLKEAADRFHAEEPLKSDRGRRSLELRKLLRRFTDVCNAIEYAHSRGVLHRDIKPGNIIVGKHGETLIVDWGLAKAVGRVDPGIESGERTLIPSSASGSAETLPGSALGTPAYMSPEQAEGQLERLGPRSDVYSLGGTLYYLLTGKPPLEGDLGDVLRSVQRGEFPPPRRHDAAIDRALEAVCLKAMAHKPADRYTSPKALSEDIERWMADEPVSAWREPLFRRVRRWGNRNRTAVTAAAAALVVGVVGLALILAVQTQAKAEVTRALARETDANQRLAAGNDELERSQAAVQARYELAVDAIKAFHTGVTEDFLLKENKFKALRERLLKSAQDFYGKLGGLLGRETDLSSRRALAKANFELAELTAKVGSKEGALVAHRAVLASRERLAAESGSGPSASADLGRSLTAVGRLLRETAKSSEEESLLLRAEAVLTGPAASDPEARGALAACRTELGVLLSETGRSEEALGAYRRAQSDQEALNAAGASFASRLDLADTLTRTATLLYHIGRMPEAEAEFRQVIGLLEALAVAEPAGAELRFRLAKPHGTLGIVLLRSGRPAEAEAEFRRAVGLLEALAVAEPAVADFRLLLAINRTNLGILLDQTGRLTEVEAEYRASAALLQALVESDPKATQFRMRLAINRTNLGILFKRIGRLAEAEAEYRGAAALYQALVEADPKPTLFRSLLATARHNLGTVLNSMGRTSEAEAEYRRAVALSQEVAEADPKATECRRVLVVARGDLGALLCARGRTSEAEAEYRGAIALLQALAEADPKDTDIRSRLAISRAGLGSLLESMGRTSKAEAEYRGAVAPLQALVREDPKSTAFRIGLADGLVGMGLLRLSQGDPAGAVELFARGAAIWEALAEAEPADLDHRNNLANCRRNTAAALLRLDRAGEALTPAGSAVALSEALVREDPKAPDHRFALGSSLTRRGQARAAAGDLAGAAADARRAADNFDSVLNPDGQQLFHAAGAPALLSGLAGRAGSGVSADEREPEARKALGLLRRAVTLGYRNLDHYRTEGFLNSLRGRDDFILLLMDLAMPSEPFARGGSKKGIGPNGIKLSDNRLF